MSAKRSENTSLATESLLIRQLWICTHNLLVVPFPIVDQLAKICKAYYDRMYACEEQKWDLEREVRKRDWEVPAYNTTLCFMIWYDACLFYNDDMMMMMMRMVIVRVLDIKKHYTFRLIRISWCWIFAECLHLFVYLGLRNWVES